MLADVVCGWMIKQASEVSTVNQQGFACWFVRLSFWVEDGLPVTLGQAFVITW